MAALRGRRRRTRCRSRYLDLRIQRDAIDGTLVAHIFDLAHDLNIDPAERLLDPAVAAQQSRGDRRSCSPAG